MSKYLRVWAAYMYEWVLVGVGRLCFLSVGIKRADSRCENLKQSKV